MIAQSGDLGVAGYVSQSYADGSIGYVEYSYALNDQFPVVQMLNAAGYYTEPTRAERRRLAAGGPGRHHRRQQPGELPHGEPHRRLHRPRPPHLSTFVLQLPDPADQGPRPVQQRRGHHPGRVLLLRHVPGSTTVRLARLLTHADQPGRSRPSTRSRRSPGAVVQNVNIQTCNNPTFSSAETSTSTCWPKPRPTRRRVTSRADPVHLCHRWRQDRHPGVREGPGSTCSPTADQHRQGLSARRHWGRHLQWREQARVASGGVAPVEVVPPEAALVTSVESP